MFWAGIARFLQYFRNLSNSFINILALLPDFYEIFLKYSLNITVLCGLLTYTLVRLSSLVFLPHLISHILQVLSITVSVSLREPAEPHKMQKFVEIEIVMLWCFKESSQRSHGKGIPDYTYISKSIYEGVHSIQIILNTSIYVSGAVEWYKDNGSNHQLPARATSSNR